MSEINVLPRAGVGIFGVIMKVPHCVCALVLFLSALLLPFSAAAQTTDADITFHLVTESSGSYVPLAVPGGSSSASILCMDIDEGWIFSASLAPGDTSATIQVAGGRDLYCASSGITGYTSAPMVVPVAIGDHLVKDYVHAPLNASAHVHIVDEALQPLPLPAPGYLYCYSPNSGIAFPGATIATGLSEATVPLTGGLQYKCNLYGVTGYQAPSEASFLITTGETKDVSLVLAPLDEHIIVQLKQADGSDYVVSAGQTIYASCMGPSSLFVTGEITAGQSTVDLSVLYGSYNCWTEIPGYATGSQAVTVASGGSANAVLQIIPKTAHVHVALRDAAGTLITTLQNVRVSILPDTTSVQDYTNAPLVSGEATIDIAPDIYYSVRAYAETGGCGFAVQDSGGAKFLFECGSLKTKASAGETAELPVTIHRTDASVHATVLNAQSTPVAEKWVQAVEVQQPGQSRLISSAETDAQGSAVIPVASGGTYDVSILSTSTGLGLAPPMQRVSPASGEEKNITLQFGTVDFILRTTAAAEGVDHGFFSCYGWDAAGHIVVSGYNAPLGETVSLALMSSSTWNVGCSGSNESVTYSSDESVFTPPSGQTSADLSFTMHQDGASFSSSFSILSSASNYLSIQDGPAVSFPASVLNGSGQFTVSLMNASGLASGALLEPVPGSGIVVSVQDGSGTTIGLLEGKTFTVIITVTPDQLGGADPESIQGAFYDPATGMYVTVPTSLDSGAGTSTHASAASYRYTLTASQTGTYVLLKERAAASPTPTVTPTATPQARPGKVRNIRARVKGKAVRISWNVPAGGGRVESYLVAVKKGRKTVAHSESASRAFLWKRPKAGLFTVSVTAENATGKGRSAKKSFRIGKKGSHLIIKY